ncbi:hypothetical protein [Aureimonas sp. ME7]|uniref:hypothetical protein n=1 Tax=Aureimonas sp. ME7 TaxID=2744252 RepID=UPI0015F7634C|nr:hypothetical protein [Aureimonas sp. ME7]
MQALRRRKLQIAGLAGISLTATALLVRELDASAMAGDSRNVDSILNDMRAALPEAQSDGSILENIDFDGRRVRLEFVADERVNLRLLRDGQRAERCGVWYGPLRRQEVQEIEYQYRQDGATSSTHLNAAVCG